MDPSPRTEQVPEGSTILLDLGNQQNTAAEVRSFVLASCRQYIDQVLYEFFSIINQSTIWKFVGRVSAITGLVCFPHGSPYLMSLGKLGYGGHLVYLFVCSFLWWLMIWGKRIQVSEKFKGVVEAILFVVICSISLVYDKYVPGKSDAYTITSYGSFALMSVSLSRKLELGFETGFSAFFLQLFASELFKIKWFLLPTALVFCSLVIILRHYSESLVDIGDEEGIHHINIEHHIDMEPEPFLEVLRSAIFGSREELNQPRSFLRVLNRLLNVHRQFCNFDLYLKRLICKSTTWNFVGGVLAINGLVCFPQGSTYRMSLGKLGYGGLLVYLLVCLFMWSLIVWAKRTPDPEKFQGLVRSRVVAVATCLIVVLDYKNDEPGKSDAYTITSCGSFALMFVFEYVPFFIFFQLFVTELSKILYPTAFFICWPIMMLRVALEIRFIQHVLFGSYMRTSGLGRRPFSTTNEQENNQEESSQAMDRSPSNGQVPEGSTILLDSGNQQNRAAEESCNQGQVSSEAPQVIRGIQNISQNVGNTPAD